MTPLNKLRASRTRARRSTGALLAALAIHPPLPSAGLAASYTFTPEADSYTRSDLPTTNFGDGGRLSAREHPRQTRNTYLRFDVDVPEGETITGATLRMFATTDGRAIELHGLADDSWDESTITWRSAPDHARPAADRVDSVSADASFPLDASSLVSGGTVSMVLTSEANSMVRMVSRENDSHRPRLIVETTARDPGTDPTPDPGDGPRPGTDPTPDPGNRSDARPQHGPDARPRHRSDARPRHATAPPVDLGGLWAWGARIAPLDPTARRSPQRVIANVAARTWRLTDWAVATADAKRRRPGVLDPAHQPGRFDHRPHPARHPSRPVRRRPPDGARRRARHRDRLLAGALRRGEPADLDHQRRRSRSRSAPSAPAAAGPATRRTRRCAAAWSPPRT